MKAGVAVRRHCCTSPPASCLALVNGGTKASRHIQALLEFAPVGDLDAGVSSSVLRGWSMERIIKGDEHPDVGVEIQIRGLETCSLNLLSCSVVFWLFSVEDLERTGLIVVWKVLL